MVNWLSAFLGLDSTWVQAGLIVISVLSLMAVVLLIGAYIEEKKVRNALASFGDFLPGKMTGGPFSIPRFEGFYKDFAFTIMTVAVAAGYNKSAPRTELRIKFSRRFGMKLRVMLLKNEEFPFLQYLTTLKRVRTGDDKFDGTYLVHCSDRERGLALVTRPEVRAALDDLFGKLYYRRVFIRKDSVEAVERHTTQQLSGFSLNVDSYSKDKMLLAFESLCAISKALN
jgi:hypothetical protein